MTLHFHFMILFYYYFKCQVHIINAVSVICTILITSQYVLSFARRTRLISLYSFPPKMLRPGPKVFAPTQVSRLNFTNKNFSIQPPGHWKYAHAFYIIPSELQSVWCAKLSPGPCSECSDCILISQGSHKAGYCDCSQQLFVFVSDINCFIANFLHRIVNPGREKSTSQHITSKLLLSRLGRFRLKEISSPFSFSLFMLKVRCSCSS